LTLTFDLHSQALLAVFIQSDQTAPAQSSFRNVTFKLTDLLKMIFDKNLFARDTDKSEENFLERLVRHQNGVAGLNVGETPVTADQMLTRFTSDLWKLAQEGGLTLTDQNPSNAELHELSNALIAFAMQFYYEDTANATDAQKELFSAIANGLRFGLFDVAETFAGQFAAKGEVQLGDAKGYQYFLDYLPSSARKNAG
jgi:hypothetical protein